MATRYNSEILCSCRKNALRYTSRQSYGYQDFEGAPSVLITSPYPKKMRWRQRRNVSKLERIFDCFRWGDIWKNINLSPSNTDHFSLCWQQARQIMWWVNSTQYSVCIYQCYLQNFSEYGYCVVLISLKVSWLTAQDMNVVRIQMISSREFPRNKGNFGKDLW